MFDGYFQHYQGDGDRIWLGQCTGNLPVSGHLRDSSASDSRPAMRRIQNPEMPKPLDLVDTGLDEY